MLGYISNFGSFTSQFHCSAYCFTIQCILQVSESSMTAILASHSCYCHNMESINQGRTLHNLSFSSSISAHKVSKFDRSTHNPPRTDKFYKFDVKMKQKESVPSKLVTNGRAVKMVPASEVKKRKTPSTNKVDVVNGSRQVVNGANLVRRKSTQSLVKTPRVRDSKELPPLEELKVLPSDEGFSWANERYNSVQRSIDVWSFVLSLRVRVLFDNAKWAYSGGFTEDKQVNCGTLLQLLLLSAVLTPNHDDIIQRVFYTNFLILGLISK